MVFDLDQMARRGAEPLAARAHFRRTSCSDIHRALQHPLDLERRDAGLMIGQPPDASDRLEQPDEEQVLDLRMHHGQIERRRAREIRALLQGIKRHQEGFHVLVGDFNTLAPGEILDVRPMPAWIRALVWMSGRDIQRETIQVMLDANYLDAYRYLHPDVKGYTFPTWEPHVRLDYVFVPGVFSSRLKSCEVITQPGEVAMASDHFPLLAHIDISQS